MSDNKEQVKRIRQMERQMNRVEAAVKRLSAALDKWDEAQEAIATLEAYYGSDLWRQDFADDEAGLLPADLKRGVLSEDGLWDLLNDVRELSILLKVTAKKKKR
ncbi:MAG: DUF4298 domain-containing protein [Muribaculaceae bacterium]|nr:DUF4298 domain-containing protein [Muribaculaceae bacterium]